MTRTPLPEGKKRFAAAEALVGLFAVEVFAAVVAALYLGRELLVPLALAGLLTFMLSPLVTRIERGIGRIAAVASVALLVFCAMGILSWVISRQALELASQLPDYRENIEKKLSSLEFSKNGRITRFSKMVVEIDSKLPGFGPPPVRTNAASQPGRKPAASAPVIPAPPPFNPLSKLQFVVAPFFQTLGTCGLVMVLVIFMLLRREDLRSRLIKIIGQGRISSTSRAMEDAGARVSRYLIAQLVVNLAFGVTVGIGLYFIGVPTAFLWGALAAVMRFIPYIGAWIAAICPTVLALAVSPGWVMVLLTLGLFGILELATANLLEPLLYRSSTGVSSLALIVSAIFWTWLWGPTGLLLSTPLTVCIGVIGRHVPRLGFLSVLLGDEEALTPMEEGYHRLLAGGLNEAEKVVDSYLGSNSLAALYDQVMVPIVTLAEMDFQSEELEELQRNRVMQGVRDIIDDLGTRPVAQPKIEADRSVAAEPPHSLPNSDCRIVCISTRGERDELAGSMLAHLLREQGFEAATASPGLSLAQLTAFIDEFKADAVCLSVIPPTTLIHARHFSSRLRAHYGDLKIVVGLWGATENFEDAIKGLRFSGSDQVVVSMAAALVEFAKIGSSLIGKTLSAPMPADEELRLAALQGLEAYATGADPAFDRMTKKLTRTFGVPIALLTLIDRDRQHFKSQSGLPEELSGICDIPRQESVCTHVLADNAPLIVEDLSRDRRFSTNPLLKKYHLRFYAGVPLRAPNGQPVGALCILDTKPRRFSEADMRLLVLLGEEISDEFRPRMPSVPEASETPAVRGGG